MHVPLHVMLLLCNVISTGLVPTLPELLCFVAAGGQQINIPREVGRKYMEFGAHLLQDDTGAHVYALERELMGNAEDINCHITREWLSGRGRTVSWRSLIEVLINIGKGELAQTIEETISSP